MTRWPRGWGWSLAALVSAILWFFLIAAGVAVVRILLEKLAEG